MRLPTPRRSRTGCIALVALATLTACHREESYEGRPIAAWYSQLADADPAVRAHAAEIIARAAPEHPETLRRLLDALNVESDSSVHIALAGALADVVRNSGRGTEVVSSLTRLMRDEHESVRVAAATALARTLAASTRPVPPDADSAFDAMLHDPGHDIRAAGADAVAELARGRADAARPFAARIAALAVADRIVIVRLSALEAFTDIPTSDSLATAVYGHALRDEWPQMPTVAVQAMARSPRLAGMLGDSVAVLLKSDDLLTRYLTVKVLRLAAASNPRPSVVAALARALAEIGTRR